jgi:ubiquinone/menaquinone biosynthesis C-methylase UbiE
MNAISPTLIRRPEAFDAVAEEYDLRFTHSRIGSAQRQQVWREMDRVFHPGERILEINCGTGVDALHFCERGIRVVACDASPAMIAVAQRRLDASPYRDRADLRVLANEKIGQLDDEGPFDGLLSNFSGLNCVADLRGLARDLAQLVRPGGRAVLCLFGRHCLWEIFWYLLHGNARKAFRRLSGYGVTAKLADGSVLFVRYPSVRSVERDFGPYFRLISWKGAGIAVPPSYLEPLAVICGRLFRFASGIDPLFGRVPGVRALADHVVLVFERITV